MRRRDHSIFHRHFATTSPDNFVLFSEPNHTMVRAKKRSSHVLHLPGDIRNQIYRHIAVSSAPIHVSAGPQIDDGIIDYSSKATVLAFACHMTHHEVKSIYYGENTFHFTEYALRAKRLTTFRRQAGSSAPRITIIAVTRDAGVKWFAGKLQFSAKLVDGKIEVDNFMSDVVSGRIWDPQVKSEDMCCCTVRYLARCWKGTLLGFLDYCVGWMERRQMSKREFRHVRFVESVRQFALAEGMSVPFVARGGWLMSEDTLRRCYGAGSSQLVVALSSF